MRDLRRQRTHYLTDRETLVRAYSETAAIYDRHAEGWDRRRVRVFYEKPWLDRLLNHAPPTERLLDLGCGTGDPVTAYLAEAGREVVGVDYAPGMLAIGRERYPGITFVEQDMRHLDLDDHFGGIVSWDGFFHLSPDEQRTALHKIATLLCPDGVLLLTVGHVEGEVTGTVEGESVYHASLAPSEYEERLDALGIEAKIHVRYEAAENRTILYGRKR